MEFSYHPPTSIWRCFVFITATLQAPSCCHGYSTLPGLETVVLAPINAPLLTAFYARSNLTVPTIYLPSANLITNK